MAFLEPVIRWFNANRAVAVLSVLLFAFFISTIALAVRKNNLSAELTECNAQTGETVPPTFEYRLSNKVIPVAYDLTLIPDLDADSFDGKIKIKVQVLENTRHIALHKGSDMVITKAQLERTGADPLSFALAYNTTLEYVILELKGVLQATSGEKYHQIYLEFSSKDMSKTNLGFYSSEYQDGGVAHKMVSSKFQPTYARRAFPCFDEPGLKAKFTIRIVTPGGDYTALSNMIKDTEVPYPTATDKQRLVTFKESVEMSTYLAVFIVSELKDAHTAPLEGSGTPAVQFTVYTAPQQTADGLYAFEVGKTLAEFYISYFGVPYPLEKLDMAAIPEYPSGATEHWGLITFRQTSFLYNKENSSARNKFRVAAVVSHELVHQWFGNLVTMNWWNDIWLNEGFASYIEYKGLAHAEPTWELMDHFTVEDLHAVLQTDSLPSTRQIVKDAATPDEITALFDAISYNKGASVIRMLDDFVGNDNFQKVISDYIKKFAYKTTVTSDFMKAFEDVKLDYNVADVMATWTEQPGYPLLTVAKLNDTFIRVSQKRYFVNKETTGTQLKYTIPIRYRTDVDTAGTTHLVWLTKDQESVDINLGGVRTWYKLNENQVGYYRVNYEESMWDELIKVQNTWSAEGVPHFSTLNRAHLLNDVFALSDGQYLSYNVTMDMMNYLQKETHLIPWTVSITQIKKILALLFTDVIQGDLLTFFHKISLPVYEVVKFSACSAETEEPAPSDAAYYGYDFSADENTDEPEGRTDPPPTVCDEEENLQTELLREKLVDLLCLMGHEDCLEQVAIRFKSYVDTNNIHIDPNVRQSVYYYGLRNANHLVWNEVFDRLTKTTDPQEATKLMYGLSATQMPFLVTTYIERAWEELKPQDFFTILQYLSENQQGGADEIVWAWVQENWPRLVERYTINERTLGRVIPNITKRFATQKKLDELNAFFTKYPEAGAGAAARAEAKETIETNIRWVTDNKPIIAAWLKDHGSA